MLECRRYPAGMEPHEVPGMDAPLRVLVIVYPEHDTAVKAYDEVRRLALAPFGGELAQSSPRPELRA